MNSNRRDAVRDYRAGAPAMKWAHRDYEAAQSDYEALRELALSGKPLKGSVAERFIHHGLPGLTPKRK